MRTLRAPGIEVHEFDRSFSFENILNVPAIFAMGFANKGIDYDPTYVYSLNDFVNTFGTPMNEAERFFYNTAKEVFNYGGLFVGTKIPYDNSAKDSFKYVVYDVDQSVKNINSVTEIVKENKINKTETLISEKLFESYNSLRSYVFNIVNDFKSFLINECEFVGTGEADSANVFRTANILFSDNDCFGVLSSIYYDNATYANTKINDSAAVNLLSAELVAKFDSYENVLSNYFSSKSLDELKNFILNINENDNEVLSDYVIQANNEIDNLLSSSETCYSGIRKICENIKTYKNINLIRTVTKANSSINTMTLENYDSYKTTSQLPNQNRIIIVDISKKHYEKDLLLPDKVDKFDNECIGIVPVIVTPINAIYFQEILDNKENSLKYNSLNEKFIFADKNGYDFDKSNEDETISDPREDFYIPAMSETRNEVSVSRIAASYFPTILYRTPNELSPEYLKSIGIVVFAMTREISNNGKISFVPLEAFIGSFDRKAKDETSGSSIFIDNVVNRSSKYINVFSNVTESEDEKFDIYAVGGQPMTSIGYKSSETVPEISYDSIEKSVDLILSKIEDKNQSNIRLLIDAGISNIAQYVANKAEKSRTKKTAFEYEPESDETNQEFVGNKLYAWRSIINKYKNLCENTRKDCMFIADGPRNLCLVGNIPLVRRTNPRTSVKQSILPNVKYLTGIETSFGSGYLNWFYCYDNLRSEFMWMPPSIKMGGVYTKLIASDNFWLAPAGVTNAQLESTYDVAFNPTNTEAGTFYENNWNYAMSYPEYGIVAEGQKTFQKNKTAFDRVNVRMLFLGIESAIYRLSIKYLYESLNEDLISRFESKVTNILNTYKSMNAMIDFRVICDSRNNNDETIENHELHCAIGIKPAKALEWIVLNFVCTSQGAEVEEILSQYMQY